MPPKPKPTESEEEEEESASGGAGGGGSKGGPSKSSNPNNPDGDKFITSKVDIPHFHGHRHNTMNPTTNVTYLGIKEWIARIDLLRKSGGWSSAKTSERAQLVLQGKALIWVTNLQRSGDAKLASWNLFKKAILDRFYRTLTEQEKVNLKKELKQGYHDNKEDVSDFLDRVIQICLTLEPDTNLDMPDLPPDLNEDRGVKSVFFRGETERNIRVHYLAGLKKEISDELGRVLLTAGTVSVDKMRELAQHIEATTASGSHPTTKPFAENKNVLSVEKESGTETSEEKADTITVNSLKTQLDNISEQLKKGPPNRSGWRGRGRGSGGRGRGYNNNNGNNTNRGRGGYRGRGAGRLPPGTTCWRCGGKGHLANQCRSPDSGERGPPPSQPPAGQPQQQFSVNSTVHDQYGGGWASAPGSLHGQDVYDQNYLRLN